MAQAYDGEHSQARNPNGVEDISEEGSVLDYLWSVPDEEQASLQAAAEDTGAHAALRSAVAQPEEKTQKKENDLSSVLSNYNGWLNSIAEA